MATLSQRGPCTRGAAALEFALVAPMMMMLLGGLISFGLIVWTNMVVAATLQSAVRTCVAMQPSQGSTGQLSACVTTQFSDPLVGVRGACNAPSVTVLVRPLTTDALAANRPTYLLQADATCTKDYLPFINFYNLALTTATIRARSALPFTP